MTSTSCGWPRPSLEKWLAASSGWQGCWAVGLAWPEVIHPGETKLVVPKSSWKLVHSERAWDTAILGGLKIVPHISITCWFHTTIQVTLPTRVILVRKAKGFAGNWALTHPLGTRSAAD
jgi:hypothetical protein